MQQEKLSSMGVQWCLSMRSTWILLSNHNQKLVAENEDTFRTKFAKHSFTQQYCLDQPGDDFDLSIVNSNAFHPFCNLKKQNNKMQARKQGKIQALNYYFFALVQA
jgi:hypothetical protein